MANTNNTFNAQEFFEGKFYAPLTLGQHEVTFGNVRAVKEETNDGTQYYILAPMTFANGRVINNRFYNFGMQIFCNQIRKQFEDVNDYASIKKFLDTLKDKTAKVLGRVGTYHITCDITEKDVNIGDKVTIDINPKFVNSDVRREYR